MTTLAPSHANRGRTLELALEQSNGVYRERGIALVHKVPTAWLPIRGSSGKIITAKVDEPACVDFLGVYRGRAIAFDAKETRKERWPVSAVTGLQLRWLEDWDRAAGVGFLVVQYVLEGDEAYLVPFSRLAIWYHRACWPRGEKSVHVDEARSSCQRVVSARGVLLDYLAALDEVLAARVA